MSRCQACGRLPSVGEVLPEIHPGQTALPLRPFQPSLESL